MDAMKKQNEHDNTLPNTAVSLKMGDLIHPPYSNFSKRKRRLEICYFKTAVRLLCFVLVRDNSAAEITVFFISVAAKWLLMF